MSITIYNSLTNQKEELVPVEDKKIRIYSCGVTVYDRSHIGHARSLYLFETIRRYLSLRGFEVLFIRNITDIDDKIINKAREQGCDWSQVVNKNIAAYEQDLKALGIPPADHEPRATENIEAMIDYIRELIDRDYAYPSQGDVYFRVRRFEEYGKLSGQSIDQMQEAVRVEKADNKEDPLDFALWKKSKEGEPSWESPWGPGRPGWHIECSVMSQKYGSCDTLDIHAGGRDLIFPHHENEIAQSEAYTGKPFAKYWIHHGLLTINGQKMAKSLGNFVTIHDAVEQYGANVLKMFYLASHYRSNIDFSDERLKEASSRFDSLLGLVRELRRMRLDPQNVSDKVPFQQDFYAAMDDDFNTPKAMAVVSDMIRWCWKLMETDNGEKAPKLSAVLGLLEKIAGIFGLLFPEDAPLSIEEQELITARAQARVQKDFKRSDDLRRQLEDLGIQVRDTPEGQKWQRI